MSTRQTRGKLRKRGPKRKPAADVKTRALSISVTAAQHRKVEKAALLDDARSVSEWVRAIVLHRAEKVLSQ